MSLTDDNVSAFTPPPDVRYVLRLEGEMPGGEFSIRLEADTVPPSVLDAVRVLIECIGVAYGHPDPDLDLDL